MKNIHYDFYRISGLKIENLSLSKKVYYYFSMLEDFILLSGFRAILFHRTLHHLQVKNRKTAKKFVFIISRLFVSIEISNTAEIGPGLAIPHGQCVVIGGNCIIGKNATIQQGVTIGANIDKERDGRRYPIIGDNVLIGAGAKILGPVKIDDNVIIGANAVVLKDIPMNSVAVGIPAAVIKTVKEPYPEFLERNFLKSE